MLKLMEAKDQGLELTFTFPMGLYYRNDKGKLLKEWVRIQTEYRNRSGLIGTMAGNTT